VGRSVLSSYSVRSVFLLSDYLRLRFEACAKSSCAISEVLSALYSGRDLPDGCTNSASGSTPRSAAANVLGSAFMFFAMVAAVAKDIGFWH
jgi:hypothetical protein